MKIRLWGKWLFAGAWLLALGVAATAATAAEKDTIRIGYVEWDSCVAVTDVAKVALEKAGYKVKKVAVTGALLYNGMASGDLDALMCAWLPTTHADYWEKNKDKLVKLGPNLDKADLGLAVPDYVDIKTIPDLIEHKDEFDNKIIGIDPGAGLMRLTSEAIEHYGLPETLVEGTDATMTAVLADSIRREEPVVVTSWRPHWMWAAYDMRYLEDPDGIYGEPDHVYTVVPKTLKDDAPKAYAVLDAIRFDRGELMLANRDDGANPSKNAEKWVEDHPDEVQAWLDAAE